MVKKSSIDIIAIWKLLRKDKGIIGRKLHEVYILGWFKTGDIVKMGSMLIDINIMRGSLLMGSKMDMVSFIPSLINILAILLITCMRGKDNSSKMVKSMWVALEMDSNMGLVVCKATKQ